jgi:GNAT superfamily N-acetyltransferase
MTAVRRDDYAGPVALAAMQSLAVRLFPTTRWRHAGDLAWSAALCVDHAAAPTAVWVDDDRTAAWAWVESPGEVTVQVDPGYPGLAGDVLAWAERVVTGPVSVTVSECEPHVMAALAERGYKSPDDGPFFACMERLLDSVPAVAGLPAGYAIRAQRDDADVAGRAALYRIVWRASEMTTERHARMRQIWPYRPELDLVAVAPDGVVAAYCQGWYDETSRFGLFEPVGTHPDYRRLGLARCVCAAVLEAFRAAGGRRAAVCPRGDAGYPIPQQLYAGLGFTAYTRTRTFTRAE